MRSIYVLGLLAALAACSRTTSEHSYDAVAPSTPVKHDAECPDLAGTYAVPAGSVAERFLTDNRAAGQGFSLLRIENEPSGNSYYFTLKPTRQTFEAAVAELAARNPSGHAQWEALVGERERARQKRQSIDVIDSRITAIGPLPDFFQVVGGARCDAYWVMPSASLSLGLVGYDDIGTPSPAGDELDLWFGRDANGALLYRIDRYSRRSLGLFGGYIRTGRTRHYDRLDAVDPALFDWSPAITRPTDSTPADTADVRRPIDSGVPQAISAEMAAAMVNQFSQVTLALLPAGVALPRIAPRPMGSEPVHRVVLDLVGTAPRNAEVSNLLRGIDGLADVSGVELVSLRTIEQGVEFEIQVTLKRVSE